VKKVAVFGNAGGGKSTVARRLADLTGLPLHVIDMMPGGEEFRKAHAELLRRDAWIIDGFGGVQAAWERFARADTLVYLDLPLFSHFLGVTRRMMKGLFAPPEGWPQGTPVIRTSLQSYGVVWPCHRHLTPKYRKLVAEARSGKDVHHLRSGAEVAAFLARVGKRTSPA
jgi:hypothetical protein